MSDAARATAALLSVALVPPTIAACLGGFDYDVAGLRLRWFDALGPGVALGGATLLSAVGVGRPQRAAARWLALLGFACVAWVAWLGPIRIPPLSITETARPAALGWLATLAYFAQPRLATRTPRAAAVPGWASAALTLMLGSGLWWAVQTADARDLMRRIEQRPFTESTHSGRDLILIVVDTLRADALGAYGATPSRTPAIDRLAAESVLFEQAFAQAPWTLPSMASLMTSRHPSAWRRPTWRHDAVILAPSLPSLALHFSQAGYATAAFVKNQWLRAGTGFERGFDVYETVGGGSDGRSAGQLVGASLRWARAFADARRRAGPGQRTPFLLYLHFVDPHLPYRPPERFVDPGAAAYRGAFDGSGKALHRIERAPESASPEDLAQMRRLYAGGVAYFDSEFAHLRRELEALDLWKTDTTIVLTSDHGEQFGEHGSFEHKDLHIENLHVPLLLRHPDAPPHRVPGVTALIDLAPTLLALHDLADLPGAEGRSRAASLTGGAPWQTGYAISEHGPDAARISGDGSALIARGSDSQSYYDLQTDPGEEHPRPAGAAAGGRRLQAVLQRHRARVAPAIDAGEAAALEVDALDLDALRALGYEVGAP